MWTFPILPNKGQATLQIGRDRLASLEELEDRTRVATSPPILGSVYRSHPAGGHNSDGPPAPTMAVPTTGAPPEPTNLTAPKSRREAHSRHDKAEWAKAEAAEYAGLEQKRVFTWVKKEDIPKVY